MVGCPGARAAGTRTPTGRPATAATAWPPVELVHVTARAASSTAAAPATDATGSTASGQARQHRQRGHQTGDRSGEHGDQPAGGTPGRDRHQRHDGERHRRRDPPSQGGLGPVAQDRPLDGERLQGRQHHHGQGGPERPGRTLEVGAEGHGHHHVDEQSTEQGDRHDQHQEAAGQTPQGRLGRRSGPAGPGVEHPDAGRGGRRVDGSLGAHARRLGLRIGRPRRRGHAQVGQADGEGLEDGVGRAQGDAGGQRGVAGLHGGAGQEGDGEHAAALGGLDQGRCRGLHGAEPEGTVREGHAGVVAAQRRAHRHRSQHAPRHRGHHQAHDGAGRPGGPVEKEHGEDQHRVLDREPGAPGPGAAQAQAHLHDQADGHVEDEGERDQGGHQRGHHVGPDGDHHCGDGPHGGQLQGPTPGQAGAQGAGQPHPLGRRCGRDVADHHRRPAEGQGQGAHGDDGEGDGEVAVVDRPQSAGDDDGQQHQRHHLHGLAGHAPGHRRPQRRAGRSPTTPAVAGPRRGGRNRPVQGPQRHQVSVVVSPAPPR